MLLLLFAAAAIFIASLLLYLLPVDISLFSSWPSDALYAFDGDAAMP